MKRLLSIVLLCTIFNSVYSQTIAPVQTGEFCPNTEYTFTASIPKPYQSIIGNGGCFVTQPPAPPVGSTFTFKGKLGDANQKQWFRVFYTDGTSFDFDFKKIKSLFFSATSLANPPCNVIKPNQVQPVVFPRCQVASTTISFPNIQWFTNFETPEICFGTVTDYEYQLPSGWSIAGIPSTGNNWIAGGNSVVVTSDLATGDGADIRIRASNKTCGTGLAANGPVSTVRISRPAPTFTISGLSQFCTTTTYQIASLPSGATVQWYISPASYFSYSQNNNILTVNRIADGDINITATVTTCQTFNALPKTVRVGGNPITITATQTACDATDFSVAGAASGATYNWSSANGTILYYGTSTTATTSSPYISATTSAGTVDIAVVNTNNSCSQSVFVSKQLQYTYPRQIDGLFDTYSNGDQINASVNTTPLDSYYIWYINGSLDSEGDNLSNFNTSSGQGRGIVCGDNTIRVEVTACGVVTSSEEVHFYKMGNCYFKITSTSNVELFPNPATSQTTIKLSGIKETKVKLTDIKSIRIMDKIGNLKTVNKYPANTKSININVSNLPLGIYYIEVSDGINKTRVPLNVQK